MKKKCPILNSLKTILGKLLDSSGIRENFKKNLSGEKGGGITHDEEETKTWGNL